MILVDTSVWIDYFRGTPTLAAERLDALLGHDAVAIGDLILTEVLQGFAHDREFDCARRLLTSLPVVDIVDRDVALEAARNFRRLRSKGVTIRKTIDTLIATRCLVDDLPLLYSDRDFDPFVLHLGLRMAIDEG